MRLDAMTWTVIKDHLRQVSPVNVSAYNNTVDFSLARLHARISSRTRLSGSIDGKSRARSSYLFLEPLGVRPPTSDLQLEFDILYDPLLFGVNEKHSARLQATLQIKETQIIAIERERRRMIDIHMTALDDGPTALYKPSP